MTQRSTAASRAGFTLPEALITSALLALLAVLLSDTWAGLGRPTADTVARCRIAQEANLAAAALARDLGGSLGDNPAGSVRQGRTVGRLVADGNQLLLCFDGGDIPNGTADWGAPDTVILYEVSSGALLRENQTTGGTRVLARHVTQLALADLGDSIRIELTLAYRDWTRTYTLIGRDP